MQKLSHAKAICLCAICIALCCVLPVAFHSLGLGSAFSPMHIPVLLCGLVCGGFYGAACGVIGPVLSSLLTGMPAATVLVTMIPELIVYGLVSGLLMKWVRTGKVYPDLYLSLVPAMILGRVVGGIAKMLFVASLANGEVYDFAAWAAGYVVGALPGIIVHLILLPVLVLALMRGKVLPARYPKAEQ